MGEHHPKRAPNGTRRIIISGSAIKTPLNPRLQILSRGPTRRTWVVEGRAAGRGAVPIPLGRREMRGKHRTSSLGRLVKVSSCGSRVAHLEIAGPLEGGQDGGTVLALRINLRDYRGCRICCLFPFLSDCFLPFLFLFPISIFPLGESVPFLS
jgi:hypothetical protein